MAGDLLPHFPLRAASYSERRELCRVLWDWNVCDSCNQHLQCSNEDCDSRRMARLSRYFFYYDQVTTSYENKTFRGQDTALRNHQDLLGVLQSLKTSQRDRLTLQNEIIWPSTDDMPTNEADAVLSDRDKALNVAVKVIAMTNCGMLRNASSSLEQAEQSYCWRDAAGFARFLEQGLPDSGKIAEPLASKSREDFKSVTALRLIKHARLRFRGTDDFRRHLKFNEEEGVVEIFHYTSFLKECLRASGDQGRRSVIPRQMCLEVIDSMQKTLFPLKDRRSKALLKELVASLNLDPDCLEYDSTFMRRSDEREIFYNYFGSRLQLLNLELQDPSPRGSLERWLQRKSSARHMMLATLIGVLIAVVLGMLALALSAFQAYVAWQQWQNPVVVYVYGAPSTAT